MSPKDSDDIDPLAGLDDDLGDDWESAFQAEDFMFSPEEEANDFFLFDENNTAEEEDELTAIMEEAQQEALNEKTSQSREADADATTDQDTDRPPLRFLPLVAAQLTLYLSFFKTRPLYQRVLALGVPSLILLLLAGSLFLRSTSEELARTDDQPPPDLPIMGTVEVGPEKASEPLAEPDTQLTEMVQDVPVQARTIRKQWDFPTFTIVTSSPNEESIFINVNLSLIAILPEGAALPEDKRIFVKDIIYQFYNNRPPHELKHFALARGEMIHKLHSWLQKQWPQSPINTVIFSQYQVVHTPQPS